MVDQVGNMKIALCGKMCSGKSTLAKDYIEVSGGTIFSFSEPVYEIAQNLFGMVEKDRELLQKIGTKMREIDPDVWVNRLLKSVDECDENSGPVIVDDVRFVNEYEALRENGFKMVKCLVDEDLRMRNIDNLYRVEHAKYMSHVSETSLDHIPDEEYDAIYYNYGRRIY